MMRSLFAGVSGLKEHQTMMDIIGNNIANVNTVGFKASRVIFEDMVSQTTRGASAPIDGYGGQNPKQVGLGVSTGSIDVIHTQGNLQSSGKLTDLAIQGGGFFILREGTDQKMYFTRNGSFDVDAANNLVNPANGLKVQGWMADSLGQIQTALPISDISIPLGELMIARPTDLVQYVGNLNSGAAIGPASQYVITSEVFDSLGNSYLISITFEKTAPNSWTWTASGPGVSVGAYNTGTIDFNTDGSFLAQSGSLEIDTSANGAVSPLYITADFSMATQFATANTIATGEQNGYSPGVLETFNISQNGLITGIYSNGSTRDIAMIAMATFRNPGGLVKEGNSTYRNTSNSGIPQIGTALTGSRGAIVSGTLEMSNVDLAKEFTDMIIGQRGFQANSKIISVADEMLTTLVNLKR